MNKKAKLYLSAIVMLMLGISHYLTVYDRTKAAENMDLETTSIDNQNINTSQWKIFESNYEAYKTKDWRNFSYLNEKIQFLIKYPEYWSLDNSIFYDQNGSKIAEILPGPVILSPEQSINNFESIIVDKTYDEWPSEYISKDKYNLNNYKVFKIVSKSHPGGEEIPGGFWYPNTYYIFYNEKAFVITFYDLELNSGKINIFDKVISTFKFK